MVSLAYRNRPTPPIGNSRRAPAPRIQRIELTPLEQRRLNGHITVDRSTGCWLWDGRADRYGEISFRGLPYKAHRLMMELFTGAPVPAAAQVHHECERKGCVNPAHLRVLTSGQHSQRHRSSVGRRS